MLESLQSIKGVGSAREKQLHRLGIRTVSQLLGYFPRAYEDRSYIHQMNQLVPGSLVTVVGEVILVKENRPRRNLSIVEVYLDDGFGQVKLTFFNQAYKKNFYKKGQRLLAYGKVELSYGQWQINAPQTEHIGATVEPERGIIPVYPLVEGVPQYILRQTLKNWFASNKELPEVLPLHIREKRQSRSRYELVKEMHFPRSLEGQQQAREALAFEELFVMQTGLLLLRQSQGPLHSGIPFGPNGSLLKAFRQQLPFSLTTDQERAFCEIATDLERDTPMQRLLQGDVGSGKTVVGALALLKAVENGYQAALMAPTEILAHQHYETLQMLCKGLPVHIALLTGTTKEKERRLLDEALQKGAIHILIGTHALIQDRVTFKNLALVIIDEQHRFGVKQRSALQEKGEAVHLLVMTATPIPRTMALSVYGDLEVSAIKEMPPGRKLVKTYVVNSSYKARLRAFFKREMEEGRQVYVVCPLVEESETLDLQAAEETFLELKAYFQNRFALGMVHGRLSGQEKDAIMEDFSRGNTQLLVSTTVIEVGVNVPNATIMCILGAERFGLSQLHQLRGRVGRGSHQSYCVLVSDSESVESKARLKLMEKIYDGFELSEQDLLLRGAGKFFGYAQHGMADLKVAHIIEDLDLLVEARAYSQAYLKRDGYEEVLHTMGPELKSRFGDDFVKILNA